MTDVVLRYVDRVEILSTQPGDVLLVTSDDVLSRSRAAEIKRHIELILQPGTHVLVASNLTFKVLREEDAGA